MRKVLPVDSPDVLRMVQRTLAPLKGEWEMAFADSAEKALSLLEQSPYDVLATDMVMPGMDGLQLGGRRSSELAQLAVDLSGTDGGDPFARCLPQEGRQACRAGHRHGGARPAKRRKAGRTGLPHSDDRVIILWDRGVRACGRERRVVQCRHTKDRRWNHADYSPR